MTKTNAPGQLPSLAPDIRLFGAVGEAMLSEFFRQQAQAPADKPLVFELSTSGGDAEIGRRIALELRLWQKREGREVFFLGKTYVYSAGITIMSAVPATHRFLTSDCELLIHERKMTMDVHLDGPLRSCRVALHAVLAAIEAGQRLEREGFEQLAAGSSLSVEDVERKVLQKDWYLTAAQARESGLVAGVI
jgi:ATP-dependent protease ClpP protease subunit